MSGSAYFYEELESVMYKVVLIDDEDIIVEGLKRVVKWESHGCRVEATAYNAADGARIIREVRPDILFTDIRMPDMDGLTMLAGLKSEFPDMQITVLTGYRDFSYAQTAIRLGVTRFLLKPSKMEEIEEALAAMAQNLEKARPQASAPPKEPAGEADPEREKEASSFLVRSAQQYIDEHYTEHLTLTILAEKTYVSPWYLSKLLNKYTGQSFSDLLNGARVKRAKELLRDPALRVHEISDLLGFSDVAHFSKTFKKLAGLSPNEYRNSGVQ